jgi:hypothetical protein
MKLFQQSPTLAKVIEANTNVTNLQSDVFIFRASISGTVSTMGRPARGHIPSPRPIAGVVVELEDSSGAILATTNTDAQGRYRFDQQSGVSATGDYIIQLMAPSGYTVTSTDPVTVAISRSDLNDTVNFSLVGDNSTGWTNSGTPWSNPFDGPNGFPTLGHRS